MLLSVAALAVSAHAQETVGGLVCGQTYDYDYIISVLGEPDYVSHDMYEFLVYKEKRPRCLLILRQVLRRKPLKRIFLALPQGLTAGIIFPTLFIPTGIPFRILHCPA